MDVNRAYQPKGFLQLTSLGSVTGLTAAQIPDNTRVVKLQAETQNVRYRDDGTNPAAGVGFILVAGAAPVEYAGKIHALKFIEAAASGKLNIGFYA